MRNSDYYDTMDRNRSGYRGDYSRDREGGAFFGRGDRDFEDRNLYLDRDRGNWSNRDERFGRSSGHHDLIASDRVEGTAVYGRDGNRLGSIHNFMVEKRGGRVRYAVMKCSDGFLGLDQRYYPLDWSELDYDTRLDGYRVDFTERDLDRRRGYDSSGHLLGRNSDDRSYQRDYSDNRGW